MADDATLKVLNEILAWTRVGFYGTAKAMLEEVLDSDKKKLAYQAMDGSKTIDAIKTEVKMSKGDVIDLYRKCEHVGLMAQVDSKRRRLFDLTSFGLLPDQKKEK